MANRRQRPAVRRGGFTLVEVALAMLVVAIGLMAAFSLFPTGLDANKAAIDETAAAMFADEVFNGYRALAESGAVSWSGVSTNQPAAPGREMWDDAEPLRPVADGAIRPLVYSSTRDPARFAGGLTPSASIRERALRYQLTIDNVPLSNLKYLRLMVWPGEFGPSGVRDGKLFYTEIYNGGM